MSEHRFYVIAYDISDSRCRSKLARLLLSYGERVQASVYECELTNNQFEKLWPRLTAYVNVGDTLRAYVLCRHCQQSITSSGQNKATRLPAFWLC